MEPDRAAAFVPAPLPTLEAADPLSARRRTNQVGNGILVGFGGPFALLAVLFALTIVLEERTFLIFAIFVGFIQWLWVAPILATFWRSRRPFAHGLLGGSGAILFLNVVLAAGFYFFGF